jgi:hypothetical protein
LQRTAHGDSDVRGHKLRRQADQHVDDEGAAGG